MTTKTKVLAVAAAIFIPLIVLDFFLIARDKRRYAEAERVVDSVMGPKPGDFESWASDPAKIADCESLVQTALASGLLRNVDRSSERLVVATVGDDYYAATWEQKAHIAVVVGTARSTGGKLSNVFIKDFRTHKRIASLVDGSFHVD